jgi:hypothetical protein
LRASGISAASRSPVDLPRLEERVLLLVEGVERGRAFVARERAVHEDEGADALRVLEREVEADPPAERVPHERGAPDPQMVEERAQILDVGEGTAWKRRLAEPAEIGADDPVALGERLELLVPEAPVADPRVDEDDRRAVAALVVG